MRCIKRIKNVENSSAESEVHWKKHQAKGFAKSRGDLPEEVISEILQYFNLGEESRVIDIGCGTGICTLAFAPFVKSVVGIDHSEAMLKEAGLALKDSKRFANVKFVRADVLKLADIEGVNKSNLSTICRAFFAFDKQKVLNVLNDVLPEAAAIAVIDEPNFFEQYEPWQKTFREVLKHWGPDIKEPNIEKIKTIDALRSSAFSDVHMHTVTIPRRWTIEMLLEVMESTTLAPSVRLGEDYDKFVDDLRGALLDDYPDGILPENARYVLHLAKRVNE